MSNFAWLTLLKATWETIYMVVFSGFLSILLGIVLGSLIFLTGKDQALEHRWLNRCLSLITNITRSIPFIILMICLIPFTHLLIGTTIGTNAAIVSLTIAAIPFFARICESALSEVPRGLIEASHAMGASTWQQLTKVLLPESLPVLIRGATLTLIGLIGYSAMAGAIGGGGLGELAINYGYQQFNVAVMLETVVILIVLVQLLQMAGDYLAERRSLKPISYFCVLFIAITAFYQWGLISSNTEVLKIGVMSGAPEKVMQVAETVAKQKFGITLQIVPFTDYVEPNMALNNGSIDANIFQHAPYLEAQIASRHYQLSILTKTFVYPMGFYSNKIKNLDQLKNGALIAIPNDPSNGARALLLLQKYHLIQLKPSVTTMATVNDIISNPLNLHFKLLDAALLPRVLNDADLVAITNDFVGPAGLNLNQAIIKEGSDSLYANIIVIRSQDKTRAVWQKLIAVMHSEPVITETEKLFPDGAAIPAWKK